MLVPMLRMCLCNSCAHCTIWGVRARVKSVHAHLCIRDVLCSCLRGACTCSFCACGSWITVSRHPLFVFWVWDSGLSVSRDQAGVLGVGLLVNGTHDVIRLPKLCVITAVWFSSGDLDELEASGGCQWSLLAGRRGLRGVSEHRAFGEGAGRGSPKVNHGGRRRGGSVGCDVGA